jgi:hypothetical protein
VAKHHKSASKEAFCFIKASEKEQGKQECACNEKYDSVHSELEGYKIY